MIGELVDNLIGVFSPASAARRVHARHVLNTSLRRGYEAANTNRLNANWRTANRSADAELFDSADAIRARARDLVRNNAYARGVQRALVRNVVGCGIKPQARVTEDEPVNAAIETAWEQWQRTADVTGRLSFYQIQSLAYAETLEAGEVLIRYVEPTNRKRRIPFALELVEADRLAADYFVRGINKVTGNEVRRGIEFNSSGEPVTYWLYSSHPNDINSWRVEAKPYPAEQFTHLFRQERIGQTRGVSIYAPVLFWLKNLSYLVENELQASAVASCFTAVIKSMGGGADGGILDTIDSSATDTDGNMFEYIQPGLVARLMPGEEVQVINPQRSHSESQAWIDLMLRSIAVGTGISYERLSRDYSKTNYSSNRASDLEDRREFRPIQDWLISDLCVPVWERWMSVAVNAGIDGFPSPFEFLGDFETWTRHIWQPPGWEWVDPVKEQQASADAIASNQSTLAEELGKRGRDWRDVIDQRSREVQYIQQAGLTDTTQTTTEVVNAA